MITKDLFAGQKQTTGVEPSFYYYFKKNPGVSDVARSQFKVRPNDVEVLNTFYEFVEMDNTFPVLRSKE